MSDTQEHSLSFVRTESIPEREPPYAASGPVKWARENLFATPANSVLTIVSLYVIYLILANTLPWILNGLTARHQG